MKKEVITAYQKEILRLRKYSQSLENKLWTIYDSKAWKIIMYIRTVLLRHNHIQREEEKNLSQPKKILSIKKYPVVSVVIPCFNYGSYIMDAIDSVNAQTYPNIEIIILNDGSTDIYTNEILSNITGIKIITQKNQGIARTRNNGINAAKGKYICCLDADDMLAPTYIQECIQKMEEEKLDLCGTYLKAFGDIFANVKTKHLKPDFKTILKENSFIVASIFTKKMWIKVKGFDISGKTFGMEDWDFWISIIKVGGKVNTIPKYLFKYRKHGKSMVDIAEKKRTSITQYILNKHII